MAQKQKTRTTHIALATLLSVLVGPAAAVADDGDAAIEFSRDIAPLLEQHCLRCHQPGNEKGNISLATITDLKDNEYVVAGDPDASYLVELVTSIDGEQPAMPKEGDPLSDEKVALLRRWISAGALWPDSVTLRQHSRADKTWWSLQPLNFVAGMAGVDGHTSAAWVGEPPVSRRGAGGSLRSTPATQTPATQTPATQTPATQTLITQTSTAPTNPIDHYILAKLSEKGLRPNPPADRRTLIRRATYDLTGLPPTPEDVEAFVRDSDPFAYEKLIDRLLESPSYGERWGRHWLDVVRFGESRGFERNEIINDIWPFRDYVIRSFNEDKPVHQLIREHLAGDVLGEDNPSVEIGSAFLVAGPYDDVGNQDPVAAAQIRANTIDEIIRATSEAFLGLTVGCARCHDHKFDPILQRDYYAWYATFSGVRHGSRVVATAEDKAAHAAKVKPLYQRRDELTKQRDALNSAVMKRAEERAADHEKNWKREPTHRRGTEETFSPVVAQFVRLVSEGQDVDPENVHSFGIDEFEVWSAETKPRNVALASSGATASGPSRVIEDFPGAYGPQLAIDGKTGARFLATGGQLTIQLAKPTRIDRVFFSVARDGAKPEFHQFVFVADYRIEISADGKTWSGVANGRDRRPVNPAHRSRRLRELEITQEERSRKKHLEQRIAAATQQINAVPPLRTVWVGSRVAADARGPFHVFVGGSPQRKGDLVVPASLSVFNMPWPGYSARGSSDSPSEPSTLHETMPAGGASRPQYQLAPDAPEADRRQALADWIVHPGNPLTPRVLANRLWHYHFGTGLVDTPSDFGYMGGRPTHPELLDWLAAYLIADDDTGGWGRRAHKRSLGRRAPGLSAHRWGLAALDPSHPDASHPTATRTLSGAGWRLKPLHKLIMMSRAYRRSSEYHETAAKLDGDSRLLWRFPPRRLSAEEIRDTMLSVSGKLNTRMGGPGFRLYRYLQDNVATYVPLDEHGPETYRRAVYHQNARAARTDLMTDFDQPDCAFSTPRRAETTTPLQALTTLNHNFTLDMASAMAERLEQEAGDDPKAQVRRVYAICYQRQPAEDETAECVNLIQRHSLTTLCRVMLNTSELIYVK